MNRRSFLASLPLLPVAAMLSATDADAVAVVDERPTFRRADYVLAGPVGSFDCRSCGGRHTANGYSTACSHPAAFRRDWAPDRVIDAPIPDDALPMGIEHKFCEIVGAHEHERPLIRWL